MASHPPTPVERVAVVVPINPGDELRDRNWRVLRRRWSESFPDWPIVEGRCTLEAGWSKGLAVADAVSRTDADILIVADADIWCDRTPDAVRAVAEGAAWSMPQKLVWRLNPKASDVIVGGGPWEAKPIDVVQRPYHCVEAGGLAVLPRSTYLDVPIDPRFVGWGGEDISWGWALRTLAGTPAKFDGDLFHLWHEPQFRRNRRRGSDESERLAGRYRRAFRQPDVMRGLLDETRVAV